MNLNKSWTEFSAEWKNVSHQASERRIHDLRVATRRVIAALEIAFAVVPNRKTRHLMREFRKLLKRLGPLREFQVHLLRSQTGNSELARLFSEFLKQREKKEVRRLRRRMPEGTRKALRRDIRDTNRKLRNILERSSEPVLRTAIEANVRRRIDAVLVAEARFRKSRTIDDLHRLRIKFKRFRYAAEVALPVTGAFTKRQFDGMRKLQKSMGEIHDLQTYMTALAEWSGRKPLPELQVKFEGLMKAFIKTSLKNWCPPRLVRGVM